MLISISYGAQVKITYIFIYFMIKHALIIRELLKGESKGLLKLPTDNALIEDSEFRRYVELMQR